MRAFVSLKEAANRCVGNSSVASEVVQKPVSTEVNSVAVVGLGLLQCCRADQSRMQKTWLPTRIRRLPLTAATPY